jgi:hypothetical protein
VFPQQLRRKEASTMGLKLVAIDLAKHVFQICALSKNGKVMFNRKLSAKKLIEELTKLAPTVVAMEACGSAHHWGRRVQALGVLPIRRSESRYRCLAAFALGCICASRTTHCVVYSADDQVLALSAQPAVL